MVRRWIESHFDARHAGLTRDARTRRPAARYRRARQKSTSSRRNKHRPRPAYGYNCSESRTDVKLIAAVTFAERASTAQPSDRRRRLIAGWLLPRVLIHDRIDRSNTSQQAPRLNFKTKIGFVFFFSGWRVCIKYGRCWKSSNNFLSELRTLVTLMDDMCPGVRNRVASENEKKNSAIKHMRARARPHVQSVTGVELTARVMRFNWLLLARRCQTHLTTHIVNEAAPNDSCCSVIEYNRYSLNKSIRVRLTVNGHVEQDKFLVLIVCMKFRNVVKTSAYIYIYIYIHAFFLKIISVMIP